MGYYTQKHTHTATFRGSYFDLKASSRFLWNWKNVLNVRSVERFFSVRHEAKEWKSNHYLIWQKLFLSFNFLFWSKNLLWFFYIFNLLSNDSQMIYQVTVLLHKICLKSWNNFVIMSTGSKSFNYKI